MTGDIFNAGGKRHDGRELIAFVSPHVASRLPNTMTNQHGRMDVVPHLHVPDTGVAYVFDLGEARRVLDPRNIDMSKLTEDTSF